MYSNASSTSINTLSSSLPPSFNFCEYMEEQAPFSAASLSSLSENPQSLQLSVEDHASANCFMPSDHRQLTEHHSSKTSPLHHNMLGSSQVTHRANQDVDLVSNFHNHDLTNIPDYSYFPFFVDSKLEQNIFDLPSDCDLQNYGVSLLDFLHKTFETPTSSEKINDANGSAETLLTNKATDGCFKEDFSGNFNGSLLRKDSSCPRVTMNADNQRIQCNINSKIDSLKPFPKPVTAVTMRQEPIVAQRACSRPVDKPVPQFARSFDVNSALNARMKTNNQNKITKPNFDLVSSGHVLHKHLQQHLYNQSGVNSNLSGTKIITTGPEIQIPLKLDTKNLNSYSPYTYQNEDTEHARDFQDPVGHLIALNNVRGLALFQGKEKMLKKHGMIPGINSSQSPFYTEVPPRPNARLPPYESHEQLMDNDWSRHLLANHMSDEMRSVQDNPKLLRQRVLHPSQYRNRDLVCNEGISSRLTPHPETCHSTNNLNYIQTGCALDGRDENGYKTSCFCAEHCFPQNFSNSGQFEDSSLGHSLRQNGGNNYQRTPLELDILVKQHKLRMQQQHLLKQQQQQQQQLLLQQHQKNFLPLNMEPMCNHPECRENLRKLQTYNEHLGRYFDSEDVLEDDMDASKPINVRLMLQQRNQDEMKQHLQNQIQRQQLQAMKARQHQRLRNEAFNSANNPQQRCISANGRIVEDFADMCLDDVKDQSNHLNMKVKTNNHCQNINNKNNNAVEIHRNNVVNDGEQEGSPTQYTSNVIGNEETFLITSPIPVRKNRNTALTSTATAKMSDKPPLASDSSRVRYYPARAFKFYMEQHVEKVMQYFEDRRKRKQQLEKEMNDMSLNPSERLEFRNLLAIKESNHLRLRRTKMDQSAFEKLANLGGGAFGNVFLVRKKDSGFLYAMKCMRKKDVWNKKQIAHVKAERDILAEADNRWVVKLYFSFQDADYLYLVMEYIPGGDLMGLLMKKGIFDHELAQFYIAELVLAIESVHRLGFIHRDIKPDNILINRNGHIKLTDFGLCTGFHWTHDSDNYREDKSTSPNSRLKRFEQMRDRSTGVKDREEGLRRKIAKSLVGTPNYIAPEVLLQSGYTSCCDWWSVGVILYEMRFGQPPFRADTPLETQRKVINWQTTLRYPDMKPRVSRETIDFISRLCCAPENRLGSREGGARDIKCHSFFTGIHFETLHSIDAPYIPQLQGSTDLSHFDAAKPLLQKPEQPRYRGGGCKYERCPSSGSSPPSSPRHHVQCNHNFYDEDSQSAAKKAPLPSYRSKQPRRSDSADSLYHSNGAGITSSTGQRHRSPGGGWGSRNGGNDYGADGSGGEEGFTRHDFFDFTFRRFFDNESESTS